MKDPRNKKAKLKAQKRQSISLNNHFGSTEASEKNLQEKKKKFLKAKWEKKKDSESTPVIRVNTSNPNPLGRQKKKDISQIICYNCSKKDHFVRKYTKPRKDPKN